MSSSFESLEFWTPAGGPAPNNGDLPPMRVSEPVTVSHRIHVDFNSESGGFQGLPPEWEKLLQSSGITQDDVKENSDAVLDILEFGAQYMEQEQKNKKKAEDLASSANRKEDPLHSNGTAGASSSPPADETPTAAPLPEERTITLSDLINKSDPTKVYPNPKKIGAFYWLVFCFA